MDVGQPGVSIDTCQHGVSMNTGRSSSPMIIVQPGVSINTGQYIFSIDTGRFRVSEILANIFFQ